MGVDREKEQRPLTYAPLAQALLDSARFYEAKQRRHITLFLLMPDHLHALLSFATDESMSKIISDWKHFQSRKHGVIWQEGYFDHRPGADERGEQLSVKMNYIRKIRSQPIYARKLTTGHGLSSALKVDRAVPCSMLNSGGEAGLI
jgi:REP element-mobilizing transposase RayT